MAVTPVGLRSGEHGRSLGGRACRSPPRCAHAALLRQLSAGCAASLMHVCMAFPPGAPQSHKSYKKPYPTPPPCVSPPPRQISPSRWQLRRSGCSPRLCGRWPRPWLQQQGTWECRLEAFQRRWWRRRRRRQRRQARLPRRWRREWWEPAMQPADPCLPLMHCNSLGSLPIANFDSLGSSSHNDALQFAWLFFP